MRTLIILTLTLLVLSCNKQPLKFQPDTKVSRSVPAGQIGPQIDTLFSSWKEFDNTDPWIINNLYANQLDNGYFGVPNSHFGGWGIRCPKTNENMYLYKSLTFSFKVITTGLYATFPFILEYNHITIHSGGISSALLFQNFYTVQPNDTACVTWTVPWDSVEVWSQVNRRDVNRIVIGYLQLNPPKTVDHNLKYEMFISELLVTGERGPDTPGKGE